MGPAATRERAGEAHPQGVRGRGTTRPELLRLLSVPEGEAPPTVEDPAGLVHDAARHGLSGVVLHCLSEAGQRLAPEAQRELEASARAIAIRVMAVRKLLRAVVEALTRAGLQPVILKGYPLGARLYPSPVLRPASDVDVLVRRDELERAEAALFELGLQRSGDDAKERYHRAHHHHINFVGMGGMVELHFRLTASFASALEWEDLSPPVTAVVEEQPVHVLRAEDELTYLAVHAAQHLFLRLSWLYDLKLLVARTPELDWDRVVSLGRKSGYASPLWCALHSAHVAFDTNIPEGVLSALSPWGPRAALLARLFSPERLVRRTLDEHRVQQYLVRTALVASTVDAGRYVAHHGTRVTKRRLAERFPSLAPWHWRG